ncbi:hypothetical protein M514_08317 [Trichuris suis]|uniref:Uncharacterized protein n=1 Tax=Trichuris suis TaxID=68888 RepID=A0A085NGF1_9BILA|nr:hypothetical protein M513_08317 [Trichuris suis]KFD68547.1 hypothetical protein M514_08317 [Trichuris suis]
MWVLQGANEGPVWLQAAEGRPRKAQGSTESRGGDPVPGPGAICRRGGPSSPHANWSAPHRVLSWSLLITYDGAQEQMEG